MTSPRKPSARSGGIRLNGSPKGEIGKALERSLRDARRAGRLPSSPSVVEVLAKRIAGVADSAWRASEVGTFMTATAKLGPLVRSLGLVELAIPAGGGSDDDEDDPAAGEGDALDRELKEIIDAGPEVRHSKNARA